MARTLLVNPFEFETSCFVCDPHNPRGLNIDYYRDDETNRVVAPFTLKREHSNAPNVGHGAVAMGILDDGMAWAIIALLERFGVTTHVEFDFRKPVFIGRPHTAEAWIERHEDRDVAARAEIREPDGGLCVAAQGQFKVLTKDEAVKWIGAFSAQAEKYVRG